MAVELNFKVKNVPSALTGAYYNLLADDRSLIHSGTTDVAADGQVNISVAGRGVGLGDWVYTLVDNHVVGGNNHANEGSCLDWIQVTDDGAPAASVYKLLPFGDSFTDRGSSGTTDGARSLDGKQYTTTNLLGYWTTAAYIHSDSDYIFRQDMGKSGDTCAGVLARMSESYFTGTDADLCILMVGANDALTNDPDTVKANYTAIVNGLLAKGLKVLLVPVVHRNMASIDNVKANTFIDDLNAHAANLASTTTDVEIVPVNTEIDTLMDSTQGTWGGISDDGLHLNNKGAMMHGKPVATALDLFYPSAITKNYILPLDFTGTGGTVTANGTGVAPDGCKALYGNNTTEDGFTGPIDKGDGKVWWQLRPNGGAPVSSNNKAQFESLHMAVPSGKYVGEITFVIQSGAEALDRAALRLDNDSTLYNYCEMITNGVGAGAFENNKVYRMRTPSVYTEAGTAYLRFLPDQDQGADVIIHITDFNFYKVEEI